MVQAAVHPRTFVTCAVASRRQILNSLNPSPSSATRAPAHSREGTTSFSPDTFETIGPCGMSQKKSTGHVTYNRQRFDNTYKFILLSPLKIGT